MQKTTTAGRIDTHTTRHRLNCTALDNTVAHSFETFLLPLRRFESFEFADPFGRIADKSPSPFSFPSPAIFYCCKRQMLSKNGLSVYPSWSSSPFSRVSISTYGAYLKKEKKEEKKGKIKNAALKIRRVDASWHSSDCFRWSDASVVIAMWHDSAAHLRLLQDF